MKLAKYRVRATYVRSDRSEMNKSQTRNTRTRLLRRQTAYSEENATATTEEDATLSFQQVAAR